MLTGKTAAERDATIESRAHKLANVARTFGLTELADALRSLEYAHRTDSVDAQERETARAQVLSCALKPDWPDTVVRGAE